MLLHIRERIDIATPRETLFHHTMQAENGVSFEGYGPIPGIRSAHYTTPGPVRVGSIRHVENTDGSAHNEEITRLEPPTRHTARIFGIQRPFALLVRGAEDDFQLEPTAQGTRLSRTFTVDVRPHALPIALLLLPFLRRAVRRDLENVRGRLEGG